MELSRVDEKTTKEPGSQISVLAIWSEIDRKLHCLTRPAHLGVLASAERLRDEEVEARGQRQANAKVGGHGPIDVEAESQRSESQRSEGQRGPESKSGGSRLARSRPQLEDK